MNTSITKILSDENIKKLSVTLNMKVLSEVDRRQDEIAQNNKKMGGELEYSSNYKQEHGYVILSDKDYDEHMNSIMAMKPKKRKNWKGSVTDKHGVKTRLSYSDGKIWDKGHAGGCTKIKSRVYPHRDLQKIADGGKCIPTTLMGLVSDIVRELTLEFKKYDEVLGCDVIANILQEIHRIWCLKIKDNNLTGNHYRTHTIKCKNLYGHN